MQKRAFNIAVIILLTINVRGQSSYPLANTLDSLYADSLIDLAIEQYILNDHRAAINNSLLALKIFDQFCELDMLAYTYHILAGLYYEEGNIIIANNFIEKAIEVSEIIKETNMEDYIDILTTDVLIKGTFSNPMEGLKKQQDIIDKYLYQFPKENQCIQYLNLAIQYSKTNDNHTSLFYLLKAYQCSKSFNSEDDQIQISLEIVNLFLDLREYNNALLWLSNIEYQLQNSNTNNSLVKAMGLRALGRLAKEYQGDYEESIELFRSSLHFETSTFLNALTHSYIGDVHDILNNCDSANFYHNQSIIMLDTLYGTRSNINSLEFMLKKISGCYYETSLDLDLIDSIHTLNRSGNRNQPLSRNVEKQLFHLLAKNDTTINKIALYSKAIQQINQIRFDIRSIESKLRKSQNDKAIFDEAIQAAVVFEILKDSSSSLLKKAFYWADISKGSVLSEQISRNTMLRKYSTDSTFKVYMDLNSEIHALRRQIANKKTKERSQFESFEPEALLLEKQNELARIDDLSLFDPKTVSENDFFEKIEDPNIMIWEAYKSQDQLYTFTFYHNNEISYKQAPVRTVDSLLDEHLINQINSIPARDKDFINTSLQLYYLIFPNDINWDDVAHLIIVPDSKFHQLSFESLISDRPQFTASSTSDYTYLFEKVSISYSFGIHLNKKYPAFTKPNISVFAPTFSSDTTSLIRDCSHEQFGALSCTNDEARYIGNIFEAKVYSEKNANSQNLRSIQDSSTYIHMATHACIDTTNFYNSAIILDDGPFLLSELYQTDWKNKSVVLSACNTAKGSFISGEGVFNFSRTLTELGVREVIVTLWPVDDCSTADFMRHFYRHLADNHPTHKALQLARLSYFKEADKLHQAPQFWAPFILISNDIGLTSNENNYWWWGIPGLLCLVILWHFQKEGQTT